MATTALLGTALVVTVSGLIQWAGVAAGIPWHGESSMLLLLLADGHTMATPPAGTFRLAVNRQDIVVVPGGWYTPPVPYRVTLSHADRTHPIVSASAAGSLQLPAISTMNGAERVGDDPYGVARPKA